MEVRYTNTFADLLRFNLYHMPRAGSVQIVFVFALAAHAYMFGPVVANLEPLWIKIAVYLATLLVWIGFLAAAQFLVTLFHYRPSKNKTLLTEHVIRATDDAFIEETAFGSSTSKWSGILKLGENRRYLFAYTQQNAAHVIPKSAFATPADAAQFANLVRARIRK